MLFSTCHQNSSLYDEQYLGIIFAIRRNNLVGRLLDRLQDDKIHACRLDDNLEVVTILRDQPSDGLFGCIRQDSSCTFTLRCTSTHPSMGLIRYILTHQFISFYSVSCNE